MDEHDEFIIYGIEEVRSKNNIQWMNIVRIAMKYAPEETKRVLREININDRKVTDLLGELAK